MKKHAMQSQEQYLIDQFEFLPTPVMEALIQFAEELAKAEVKHPIWPEDKVTQAAIVCEESGELLKAALQHDHEGGSVEAMQSEAIQTGAMALRFLLHTNQEGK